MKHQKIIRAELMYSSTKHKEQTGNSYIASCQYFPGLPNLTQSLSVCHEHCPFFLSVHSFCGTVCQFWGQTKFSQKQ